MVALQSVAAAIVATLIFIGVIPLGIFEDSPWLPYGLAVAAATGALVIVFRLLAGEKWS